MEGKKATDCTGDADAFCEDKQMNAKRGRMVFVTGTGTGVGKTVLTALLLAHLRSEGKNALAVKPFCSGGRGDAEALWRLEKECLTLEEVNPFYFDKPVAPLAAARGGGLPSLKEVVKHVKRIAGRCDILLIEGSGGLLVPLGEDYTVADLIGALGCAVIVASRNELGTINHTLLTLLGLEGMGIGRATVVMMDVERPDESAAANLGVLVKMAPKSAFVRALFLGRKPLGRNRFKKSVTFLKKTLARILELAIVTPSFERAVLKKSG